MDAWLVANVESEQRRALVRSVADGLGALRAKARFFNGKNFPELLIIVRLS